MAVSRLLRPTSRLLALPKSCTASYRTGFRAAAPLPSFADRRSYATPSGVKEVAVRDALNEALAEELESNDKVFVLGEEVAQYNGAYVEVLDMTIFSPPVDTSIAMFILTTIRAQPCPYAASTEAIADER